MNEINEYREIEIEGLGIVFHSGGILKMRQDKVDKMPDLNYDGVPMLVCESEEDRYVSV